MSATVGPARWGRVAAYGVMALVVGLALGSLRRRNASLNPQPEPPG